MVEPFVDIGWWQRHSRDLITADVRWYMDGRRGVDAYDKGHIPGAIFVDVDKVLSGDPSPMEGRHPLPSPQAFARSMANLGISDNDIVVAYDDAGGVIAARLVWMLRATGHQAALLDGGINAYDAPLEQITPPQAKGCFSVRLWPDSLLAQIGDAMDPANVVLDARPLQRYLGAYDTVDPRAGHIPGALSLPCRENLTDEGKLLPLDELRSRFERAGAESGSQFVSYCGSGVTACHTLLIFEHLGLGQGRLYPGSWSQYSHTNYPVEVDGDR